MYDNNIFVMYRSPYAVLMNILNRYTLVGYIDLITIVMYTTCPENDSLFPD